jgi:hypothetical protein
MILRFSDSIELLDEIVVAFRFLFNRTWAYPRRNIAKKHRLRAGSSWSKTKGQEEAPPGR